MQNIGGNYNTIVQGQYRVDTRFVIGSTVYGMNQIKSATIDGAIFDDISIGNATTRELHLTIKGMPDIPRGAQINVQQQVYNTTYPLNWSRTNQMVPKGTFYISKRNVNRKSGTTEIIAYDAMNKMDSIFFKTGTWASQTALAVVQAICSDVGISLASGSSTILNDGYVITHVPAAGDNGTTRREMLQEIGVLYGGNWIISDDNKLTLVQLKATPTPTVVGSKAGSCTNQAALPAVDRVKLINGSSAFESADFSTLTGTIITCNSAYASDATVARVLSKVTGYVYQPYKADRAYVEPAAGLGDRVTVFGLTSVIASQSIRISHTCPSNISADHEEEAEDEYGYVPPVQREMARQEERTEAAISALEGQIELKVSTSTFEAAEATNYQSITPMYLANDGTRTPSVDDPNWQTTPPQLQEGQHMWTMTVYVRKNGVTSYSAPMDITGTEGVAGRGIDRVDNFYQVNNSGDTAPTTWLPAGQIPSMTPTNRFLWGYETTYYTDNTSESTTPHVIGVYGAAGANGKLLYGTCSTTAGTAEKAVVCSEATELYSGLTITVKFSTANTANVPTLNVNQLGAKAIWVDNVVTSSTNSLFWNTNALITFMYDGTQFVVADQATTYYTTCSTGATTAAKAAACAACVVRKGTTVTVQMTNAHTGTSAATLYVNGQSGTARTIYINGATVTNAAGNSWAAGEAVAFVFNGQYWYASKGADGADGADGRGVVSSSVTYQIHSSGTTAPTGTWSTTVPETTAEKPYLWTKTEITYTSGNPTTIYSVSVKGETGGSGSDGRGISSIVNYYAKSSSNTQAPTSWNTTPPTLDATNKYLWNYEVINYTSGSPTTTTAVVIGVYSSDGKGISSITEYYALSTTTSTPADSSFSTTVPTMTSTNKYLWNYEYILYTDNSFLKTDKKIIGVYGLPGDDGVGISGIQEWYGRSRNANTQPTASGDAGSWSTTLQNVDSTWKFLWNYEVVSYTDNTNYTSAKRIIGTYGDPGQPGKAPVAFDQYLYASTSSETQTGGQWIHVSQFDLSAYQDDPEHNIYYYIWTKTITTYDDSSTTETQPYLDTYYTNITARLDVLKGSIEASVSKVYEDLDITDEFNTLESQVNGEGGYADRLNAIDDPENGQLKSLETRVSITESDVTTATNIAYSVQGQLQEQTNYMRWNGSATVPYLEIGRSNDTTVTQVRSNAFAVVNNGVDVFTASEAGASARAFIASSSVDIGNYRWVDEGDLGFSLI